jgi:diguanylate cyclase (GGDEF)-like protein/PAS domain S-box-containing protein
MMNMNTARPASTVRHLISGLRQHWPVAGVFLLCIAIACGAMMSIERRAQRSVIANATADAIDYERRFQQGLDGYVHFGRHLAAFAESAEALDASKFGRYLQAVNMLQAYPGVNHAGYIAPSGKGSDHYRVRLIYPQNDQAQQALDADVTAVPARWEAMQRARDSGRPVATAKQNVSFGQARTASVLLLVPVYDPGLPAATLAQRRSAVTGFVFLQFDIGDVVEGVMGPRFKDLFELEIYDGAPKPGASMYDSSRAARTRSAPARYPNVYQQKAVIADRDWSLVFYPGNLYFERYQRAPGSVILLAGLFLAAGAAFLTAKWRRHQRLRAVRIEQGHRFDAIFENHPSAVYSLDLQRRIVQVNAQTQAKFKMSKEELLGMSVERLIIPEHVERFRQRFDDVLHGNSVFYESAAVNGAGERIETAVIMIPVTSNGVLTSVLGIAQNVTARKQAEWQLKASRNMLQLVIDHIPQRVFWKNTELVFIGCNEAFCGDAGLDNPNQLLGKSDFEMRWSANADAYRQDDFEVMRSGVPRINYEESQHRPDGVNWLRTSKIPIANQDGAVVGILGLYEDITERKALERKMEVLAHYDSLTGLANRTFFHGHVEQAVLRSRRHDTRAGLMYLDLDKFKSINDTYGHAAGDELLVQFAGRIKAAVREMDVVGRLGGDEFALLMEDLPGEEAALLVAEKIVQGMRAEFRIGSHVLQVSTSVGVAILTPGMTVDALIAKADEAMYAAKRGGRNRFAIAPGAAPGDARAVSGSL